MACLAVKAGMVKVPKQKFQKELKVTQRNLQPKLEPSLEPQTLKLVSF